MSTLSRFAVAAAAVLVVAVIGILLLPGFRGGVGGPDTTTTPSPTSVETAAIPATRSPVAPAPADAGILTLEEVVDPGPLTREDRQLTEEGREKMLASGRHRVEAPFAVPFSIQVRTEWVLRSLALGEVSFQDFAAGSIGLYLPTNVFADPCNSVPTDPPVAQTVDGIVTALSQMAGFKAEQVTDVTLDGHPGKSLVLNSTVDASTSACPKGTKVPLFSYRGSPEGVVTSGWIPERLSIIDVNGTPVIIRRGFNVAACPGTPPYCQGAGGAGHMEGLETVIQSIDFED